MVIRIKIDFRVWPVFNLIAKGLIYLQIYFDNAATTPTIPFTHEGLLANPSSPHVAGIEAERKLTLAREEIARILNSNMQDIIFTSGGTESNNIALLGFAFANLRKDVTFLAEPWEHPSILEPLKYIKEKGLANVHTSPREQWNNVSSPTRLAAISHINSETGDINPVASIAEKLKAENPCTTVVVDGVQGFCKEKIQLDNIDIITFSAHKFHGPAGVGGLAICPGIRLMPLMYGGGQEKKLRPGTENVHGVLHMVEALRFSQKTNNVATIKHILSEIAKLPNVFINEQAARQSPYILNMSFMGIKSEPLVHLLSEKGLYASTGAACRTRKNSKSPLVLMGFSQERADSAVRFSFSALNTVEEAHAAKAIIIECVNYMRSVL